MTCEAQLILPLSFPFFTITPRIPTIRLAPAKLKRRRSIANAAAFSSSMELPLLPFTMEEVFVPAETKTLHLYEARYLALLEERAPYNILNQQIFAPRHDGQVIMFAGSDVMQKIYLDRDFHYSIQISLSRKNKLFVHFVLEPISIGEFSAEVSFAAKYECLVLIENVERLEVGALVSIRGIGRVKIVKFVQVEPYLKGIVTPVQDRIGDNVSLISSKVEEVKEALRNLNSLEIKLKTSKEELLQTNAANSLSLAEEEPSVDCHEDFVPPLTERVSFAPFRPVSGTSKSDLMKLNSEKIRAMNQKDTQQRLDCSLALIKENISLIAAKLAIQSLDKQ